MTINIQDLLGELVSYTLIRTSNVSNQAKSALSVMRPEFKNLEESQDANKPRVVIAKWEGGF